MQLPTPGTPSSRSGESTPPTRPRWSRPVHDGFAWCVRSATPPHPPPRPKLCAKPFRRSEGPRRVPDHPRKRKRRGASPSPRERMERGYARAEERNRDARDALEPLADGERPLVVTIGAVVSTLIAISVVVGYLVGGEVNGEKPRLAQVLAPVLLMGVMAWGMWRARYWAVLGFQLILVLLIFSAFFGLVVGASSLPQIAGTTILLVVAGAFFYFMVKAMARIQMPTRE